MSEYPIIENLYPKNTSKLEKKTSNDKDYTKHNSHYYHLHRSRCDYLQETLKIRPVAVLS